MMAAFAPENEFVVNFPTLGDLADAWITRHCRVPDGFARGKPMKFADWQFWCIANRYRIREDAVFIDPALVAELLEAIANGESDDEITNDDVPLLNQAFFYRQTLVVAPQKTGKGPMSAACVAFEACGPSVFAGFAEEGDEYRCSDNGCDCGWVYEYLPGEAKGMRHPSPLIQITATSADQADNIYRPLRAMVKLGPLRELLAVREGFIRILGLSDDDELDRIDVVTASANSRLGNPISDAEQDEVGLYYASNKMINVAEVQRRGAAGMGGRTHATTNAWDPAMNSYAQQVYESGSADIFVFYRNPDLEPSLRDKDGVPLSFKTKANRRRIFTWVYEGSWWVNLDSIEAEAAELMKTDPAQAERFFGNRLRQGADAWLRDGAWSAAHVAPGSDPVWIPEPEPGTSVCGGFDGSLNNDWTAIKLETREGLIFTPRYGPDRLPAIWNPAKWGGTIPRSEVNEAWAEITQRFNLLRAYCDPGFHDETDWSTEIETWGVEYGTEVFVEWPTNQIGRMYPALRRFEADLDNGTLKQDGCPITTTHVGNARKFAKGLRYYLSKPSQHQKIDAGVTSVLCHEAAADMRAAGWPVDEPVDTSVFVFR